MEVMTVVAVLSLLTLTNIVSGSPAREITGRLVWQQSNRALAHPQVVLNRPPGDYTGIAGLTVSVQGMPQAVTIAKATTDENGRFRFVTQKDRGRYLRIHLAGISARSDVDPLRVAVKELTDTLHPTSVEFDDDLFYDEGHHWHLRKDRFSRNLEKPK